MLAWEMQGINIVILHIMATSQSEKQHAFPHIDYVFDNQKLPTVLNKISIVLAN